MKAAVGDWISFYRDGRLVIAEVRYVRPTSYTEYLTDIGAVASSAIFEVRAAERAP